MCRVVSAMYDRLYSYKLTTHTVAVHILSLEKGLKKGTFKAIKPVVIKVSTLLYQIK